jgi:hypothetical protein
MLVSYLAYSSNLKIGVTCFSETSVDLQRTIRHYITEDRTLHNHRCENLTSINFVLSLYWKFSSAPVAMLGVMAIT